MPGAFAPAHSIERAVVSPRAPDQSQVAIEPPVARPAFDIVVIGASAGGLVALSTVLAALSPGFPVPVVLVLHLSPVHPSHLAGVLARVSRLPVFWAAEGSRLEPGTVYVAPPDWHVTVVPAGVVALTQSPPVHFARPSVDLLFVSAANAFGPRTLAVILTGNGYDGSNGVAEVHRLGGVVIAQDEASSEYFSMPREAIESGGVSFVLPLESIAPAVTRLVTLGAAPSIEARPIAD